LLLLEGIVLVFLSMMWLVSLGMTTVAAVRILGVYWLVAVLSLVFGALLLLNIEALTYVLPWALGGLSLLGGVAAIAMAFSRKENN
jgi:uncharacterized membrane protein HdeD (DUF308 family)